MKQQIVYYNKLTQSCGAKELVPAKHHVVQIQIVQHDLRNSHKHLLSLDSAIVAPNSHLKRAIKLLVDFLWYLFIKKEKLLTCKMQP